MRAALAATYADLLGSEGLRRGLIGPRELDRIWSRHLVNAAVIAPAIPTGALVADVGSGAGLPGIPLAIARPDLRVRLVEPVARRVEFLQEVVAALGLDVEIVRARAEDLAVPRVDPDVDIVTARAVAPLDRLVRWCLPLVRPGGSLLAIKGARAEAELADARLPTGVAETRIEEYGAGLIDPPTRVIRLVRAT